VALSWHERFQRDPGHRWFRQGLLERLRQTWRAQEPQEP
jgi:DNA-binding transcriptional LysR family regulator